MSKISLAAERVDNSRSDHDPGPPATVWPCSRRETYSQPHRPAAKIVAMKRSHWLIVLIQALLVILLLVACRTKAIPLGVRGEWEWLRISALPSPEGLLMAVLAVVLYCGFAGIGLRAMGAKAVSRLREACWLAGLLAAAVVVQFFIPAGRPTSTT